MCLRMCADISKCDEETQLYFDFGSHGWSELIFVRKGQVSVYRMSDVFTDAPSAILQICDAVLENAKFRVALCDEPGGVIVEVTPDTEQQHTVILSVYEIRLPTVAFEASEAGHPVMTTRLKRRRLVGMLLSELWKNHKFLSEPSYQKSRRDFPHARLIETNKTWNRSALGPSFLV